MVQGVLAAAGAEVIADRLLGQDDGAHSACPLAQQLELGGLEVIPVQGPDGRFSLPFAAMHESGIGPSRHFGAAQLLGRFRSEADINRGGHKTRFMSTRPNKDRFWPGSGGLAKAS